MILQTRHWQRRVWRCAPFVLVLLIALVTSSSAQAGLVINATFDSSITGDSNAAAIENTINQVIGQ